MNLLAGSIPGVIIGSHFAARAPDTLLRWSLPLCAPGGQVPGRKTARTQPSSFSLNIR